ncbi:MAG: T9SS type A sorting domain-containing protein, partial [Bacteroidia bacterium]
PTFSSIQLALNNKIYVSATHSGTLFYDSIPQNLYLSVINNPNESGLACNYEHLSVWLGGHRSTFALPNSPNYNLGPLEQSECDTLSTSINSINYNSSFTIAPNPAKEMFYIKTKQNTGGVFTLRIVNTQGAEAMYFPQYIPGSTVSISQLPEGMYTVLLTDEKGFLYQQKLIISR